MRKSRLFVLILAVMLSAAGYAQTETGEETKEKGKLFFAAAFNHGIFGGRALPLFPDSDMGVTKLSPAKLGAYWEMPMWSGFTAIGLEAGYASGSRFGGAGGTDFIPVMLSGSYAYPFGDFFAIGPSLKLGILGAKNPDWFKVVPLIGARLEAELKFNFPVSLYASGGADFFPLSANILPLVEVGVRIPRGKWNGSDTEESRRGIEGQTAAAGTQTQSDALVPGASVAAGQGVQGSVGAAGGTVTGVTGAAGQGVQGSVGAAGGTVAGATGAAGGTGAIAGLTGQTQPPAVTSVTVTPSFSSVTKGQAQQFGATVSGNNNPAQTVNWTVLGGGAGTSINSNGLLTVAPSETATNLSVRAASTADPSKSGAASVAVTSGVIGVTVTPSFSMVTKGQAQQFGATVSGNNNPAQTVNWTVLGGGAGTSINSNGLLTVAPNETASSLVVRATSTADPSKSDTAAVAAIAPAASAPVTGTAGGAAGTGTTAGTGAAGTTSSPAGGTGAGAAAGTGAGIAGGTGPAAGQGAQGSVGAAGGTGTAGAGTGTPPAGAGAASGQSGVVGTVQQMFFRAVYFEPDSAVLLESSRLILEGVGHQLMVDPDLQVILRSYTAPFGTAEGREMVSESRKDFCRNYLVQQYGVSPSRITTESWASERMPEYARGTDWESYRCVEFAVGK